MPLNVTIDTYPIEFTFDERDLVDSSTQERYTGFCPVNIEVENPTFPLLYKDANDQLFEQPIEHNGKYKMVPYVSEPGTFPVSGYVPKYIADQSTSDYDLFLNIPNEGQPVQPLPPNTCYFDIDTEVVQYVNSDLRPEEEQGTLRLPSDDTGLMNKVNFDIGDKDYATEVAIDLSGIQIVEDNTAVLDITPAVLQYVNDDNYQRQGLVNLPDGILNALTDFEDNGKGFATNLVINVASLANLVPRPELNNNTVLLQQNGTYQIGNFDNDDADVEIEPSSNQQINPNTKNKVLSIRKIENTKDNRDDPENPTDDPIEPEEPEPEPEPTTNYTIGTFTIDVKPLAEIFMRYYNRQTSNEEKINIFDQTRLNIIYSGTLTYSNNGDLWIQLPSHIQHHELIAVFAGFDNNYIDDNSFAFLPIEIGYEPPSDGTGYVTLVFENRFMNINRFILIDGSDNLRPAHQSTIGDLEHPICSMIPSSVGNSVYNNNVHSYSSILDLSAWEDGKNYIEFKTVDLSYLRSNWPSVKQSLNAVEYAATPYYFTNFTTTGGQQQQQINVQAYTTIIEVIPDNYIRFTTYGNITGNVSYTQYDGRYYYICPYDPQENIIYLNDPDDQHVFNIKLDSSSQWGVSFSINHGFFNIDLPSENPE